MLQAANRLPLWQAATLYALNGLRVFPCRPGGKEPLVKWADQATDDLEVLAFWWHEWPEANIGLAMGGGWAAVDVDVKGGQNGPLSFELAGGPLDRRWPIQTTPSGGMHHLIRGGPTGLRNVTRKGLFGGLDLRVDRGYIVAAPSVVMGKPYQWLPGGDPGAPLPPAFEKNLVEWSQRAAERDATTLPDVTPTPMTPAQVQARVEALGAPFTGFLRTGKAWTGDMSRDAYAVCLAAFRQGWTLEDMERIGPETVLAHFGGQPPHGAANPWAWFKRYTLTAAWADHQAHLGQMFSPLAGQKEAADGGSGEEDSGEREESLEASIALSAPKVNTFELWLARARALPHRDHDALEAWIKGVLLSGLPDHRINALLVDAKDASGYTLALIRETTEHHRDALRAATKGTPATQATAEVFVRSQDKFYDRRSGAWITKGALASALARDHGGDPDAVLTSYLHGTTARVEVVEELTYDPALAPGVVVDTRGVRALNKYRPSDLMPRSGDVGPWLDLLKRLDVEGGHDVCERLMDEMAFMVQHPGRKINHGVLLGGAEGIGKDSWLAPILSAIGTHNVRVIHGEDLAGDFQGWLAGSKMVVVNEVRFGSHRDREKIAERLKPLAAAPPDELHVNEKNLRPYWVPNRVQLVGMTNHRDAIHAADGTRRYFCVWAKLAIPQGDQPKDIAERTQWEAYFKTYWAWLEHGGRQAVYGWLLARPVAHVNPGARPMRTPWLEDMIDLGRDPTTAWIYEQIESGRVPFDGPRVLLSQIMITFDNNRSMWSHLPSLDPRNVALAMARLGCRGERTRGGAGRDTAYILRGGQHHESVDLGNVIDLDAHRSKANLGLIDSAAWI